MSADRYDFQINQGCRLEISVGGSVVSVSTPESHTFRAIRQQARDLEQLRTDLAAAVSENAALLAANRDLKAHFDALNGDYDEAAHFARHFIRDDAAITPRGAIIRLGDKCTDLFVRLQQAEARLAAIEAQPVVAVIASDHGLLYIDRALRLPPEGTELIARPAKD